MSDLVTHAAAEADAIGVPILLDRMARLGEIESGAYNFYATRLGRGSLFANYELALARRLSEAPERPALVHEIGGGWATLSLLLALVGLNATALELDRRRFETGAILRDAIVARRPDVERRFTLVHARFPSASLKPDNAAAIATNLVFTTKPEDRRAIIEAIAQYKSAVIDIDRFLARATSEADGNAVVAEFEAAGMRSQTYLDMAASARFRLFVHDPDAFRAFGSSP